MTLVVSFAMNSYPVMLADILLSAEGGPYSNIDLPSVKHIRLPADQKKHPIGSMQKLTVISNEMVIGWSGRASTAQREIQHLRKLNETEPLTVDALRECFIAMESRILPGELTLIGFLKESEAKRIQLF